MKYLLPVLLSLFLLTGCSDDSESPTTPSNPTPGPTPSDLPDAPSFNLDTDTGQSMSLSDYKGDVLVIFFFGNNCPPCKGAAPKIESDLTQKFKDKVDFSIIGIDQWDGNKSSVESFRNTTEVTFPLGLKGSGVAKDYGTTYDRLVIVDKEGKLAFVGKTQSTNDLDKVVTQVQSLLN